MARRIPLSEVVSLIAEQADIPKSHVSATLRSLSTVISSECAKDNTVDLGRAFGHFTVSESKVRTYSVPTRPGESVTAGGRRKVKFVPSAGNLKDVDGK